MLDISWGISNICNYRCEHCFNVSGRKKLDELSFEDLSKIGRLLVKKNVRTIKFGTGEPGLEPKFWKIIEFMKNISDIKISLITNGSSVTERTIDQVVKFIDNVDVSVHFADEKENDDITQFRGSFKRALIALDLLEKYKVRKSIVTCLMAPNCDIKHVSQLVNLAKERHAFYRISWFKSQGRGKEHLNLELDPIKVNKVMIWLFENTELKSLPDPYFSTMLKVQKKNGAVCGRTSFRITPTGTVIPCVYYTDQMQAGNILKNSIEEIYQSKPFKDTRTIKPKICIGCKYWDKCRGGCAARRYFSSGGLDKPDPFCFRAIGLKKNPFENIKFKNGIESGFDNVCTAIFKPL